MMGEINNLLKQSGKTFEDFWDENMIDYKEFDLTEYSQTTEREENIQERQEDEIEDDEYKDFIEIEAQFLNQVLDILEYMETTDAERVILGKNFESGKFKEIKKKLDRFYNVANYIMEQGGEPGVPERDFERIHFFIIEAEKRRKAAEYMKENIE